MGVLNFYKMSATTDADRNADAATTATYKSVASIDKINVAHDIVIKDFKDWRSNTELLGDITGTMNLPIPNGNASSSIFSGNGGSKMLEWIMKSEATGDISIWISNKCAEKLLLKFDIEFRECSWRRKLHMNRLFEPNGCWGYKQLITKDVLDNQIDTLTDRNGHLNIHLKICLLQKGSTATKRVYEPGLNDTDQEVQRKIKSIAVASLSEDMTSFRSNGGSFTDLTIVCQDKTFQVHSAFLCSRSTVFAAMLRNDTLEARNRRMEIRDTSPETLELFLRFLYESKLPPMRRGKTALYQLAQKYDVQALVKACRLFKVAELKAENLVGNAILGYLHNDNELKKAAISMMGKEVGPLKMLQDWGSLKKHPELLQEITEELKQDPF